MPEIITAKSAGFCFGVERALQMVYEQAESHDRIYTLGPIIHNEEVVRDLESRGVRTIHDLKELESIRQGTLIIRSHGIAKSVQEQIEQSGLQIIDATCPFVKRIHQIVEKESREGKQIIIIGDPAHPEVIGIKGWCISEAKIVNDAGEAENLVLDGKTDAVIVAQTTFNYNKLKDLVEIIKKKKYNSWYVDTVCHATSERQEEAVEIADKVDAMIVIGSFHSSNTQKLFEMCRQYCADTLYIQTVRDLDIRRLSGKRRIGITAGASTPKKIIEEVQLHVRAQFSGDA